MGEVADSRAGCVLHVPPECLGSSVRAWYVRHSARTFVHLSDVRLPLQGKVCEICMACCLLIRLFGFVAYSGQYKV